MKKLLSKKNGFTLVEILIAFAIFAIMAAMILAIIRLAVSARNSNVEFTRELEAEQGMLVENVKQENFDSSGLTGEYSLNFTDGKSKTIKYQVLPADSSNTDPREGLSYFVPNVKPGGSDSNEDPGNKTDDGKSQAARYDTRITATKGIDYIKIMQCKKDATYTVSGQTRYLFEVSVFVDPTNTKIDPYANKFGQIKLYFKNEQRVSEVIGGRDCTVSDKPLEKANVLEAGYVNSASLDPAQCTPDRNSTTKSFQDYQVLALKGSGGVQLGIDYSGTAYADRSFKDMGKAYFYVIFEGDPELTVDSFGENSGESGKYTSFLNKGNKVVPNIYGAYLFKE